MASPSLFILQFQLWGIELMPSVGKSRVMRLSILVNSKLKHRILFQ